MVFLRDPLSASGSPHSFGDVSPLVASVLPKRKGIFGPLVNGEEGHTNKVKKGGKVQVLEMSTDENNVMHIRIWMYRYA
jgi:hypothetical protein